MVSYRSQGAIPTGSMQLLQAPTIQEPHWSRVHSEKWNKKMYLCYIAINVCIKVLAYIHTLLILYLLYRIYSENFNASVALKVPKNAISEHQFFKIFGGGMPTDPPSISMLCMLIVPPIILKIQSNSYTWEPVISTWPLNFWWLQPW